jgi:hypothetical protein
MNGEIAIQQARIHGWPSKLLTVMIVAVGLALLCFDGVVAASLTQTNVGLSKAVPIAYLIAAVGVPVGVGQRSLRSQGSRLAAVQHAALASIAMNIAVLPYVVLVLSA